MTKTMSRQEILEILDKPYARELLNGLAIARFAYDGLDGEPRVVPIGFSWDGSRVLIATATKAAKVAALRKNPKVALTIDTAGYPPKVLLLRGTATVEIVEGVPDFYIESGRHVGEEQFDAWEAGVRGLYDQMAVISIELHWAKLLDFETTIPKAVEDLVREKASQQG
jgi:Pyridoxamine 5'-phosphate oxidase